MREKSFGLRDAQRERPAAWCSRCGGELYRQDMAYCVEGMVICEECLAEFAKVYFQRGLCRLEEWREGEEA